MITPGMWSSIKSILIGATTAALLAASQYLLESDWGDYKLYAVPIIGLLTSWAMKFLPQPKLKNVRSK